MDSLAIAYTALSVFGVGVTIVDLFGLLDHAAGSGHEGSGQGSGSSHDDDAGAGQGEAGHAEIAVVGVHGEASHDDAIHGDDSLHDDSGHEDGDAVFGDGSGHHGDGHGSIVASADSGVRAVARAIGVLRVGVYFSLGAGPTGLFAALTGVGPGASLAWSAGAGLFIAVLSKAIRSLVRRDLDSSISPSEYIMDEARVTVTVRPGAMGKAAVRAYGAERELFVRAKDPKASFEKGATVRIVDYDDDCYWIELP